tara:strand:- start:1481 stop:1663 length:183 start_codon:yes stop_codon:yes gene_type:complete
MRQNAQANIGPQGLIRIQPMRPSITQADLQQIQRIQGQGKRKSRKSRKSKKSKKSKKKRR